MNRSNLILTLGQRLLLLLCLFVFFYAITMGLVALLAALMPAKPAPVLRIGAVLQDVLAFIAPAVITAMVVTRRPADLLCLLTGPKATAIYTVFAVLVVSIPFQEAVIYWNDNWTFPEWAQGFAAKARELEDSTAQSMALLLGDGSKGALVVNLLIIGVGAGFSEELLFRGCFQRLLTTGGVNRHVAVWTVAVVFSLLHFQLFGFVPRLLLGAYFGYLLVWTRSIWLPMLAHTLNNCMVVLIAWINARNGETPTHEPSEFLLWLAIPSCIVTLALLYLYIYKPYYIKRYEK